jgi:hypothetical protein
MFNFTPLLGAQSASPASQSLLEFDGGIKVLIDVGWDESFDAANLKEIEKYVQSTASVFHVASSDGKTEIHEPSSPGFGQVEGSLGILLRTRPQLPSGFGELA